MTQTPAENIIYNEAITVGHISIPDVYLNLNEKQIVGQSEKILKHESGWTNNSHCRSQGNAVDNCAEKFQPKFPRSKGGERLETPMSISEQPSRIINQDEEKALVRFQQKRDEGSITLPYDNRGKKDAAGALFKDFPKYRLFDHFQVIGDTIVYSIARTQGLVRIQKEGKTFGNFYSAFERLSIDYIAAHVRELSSVSENVLLSVGFIDQIYEDKSYSQYFRKYFELILKLLHERGAKNTVIVVPPPHPEIRSGIQCKYLLEIRKIIAEATTMQKCRVYNFNIDDLFFSKKAQDLDLIKFERQVAFPNFEMKATAFEIGRNNLQLVSKVVCREILSRPKNLVARFKVNELVPQNCVINQKRFDEGIPRPYMLTAHGRIPTLGEPCLRISVQINGIQHSALADSGATTSVISKRCRNEIIEKAPKWYTRHKLKEPQVISIAVGQTQSQDEVLGIRFQTSPTLVLFSHFMVVNGLNDNLILGANFFKYYSARIDFKNCAVRVNIPNGGEVMLQGETAPRRNIIDCPDADHREVIKREPSAVDQQALLISTIYAFNDRVHPVRAKMSQKILRAAQLDIPN